MKKTLKKTNKKYNRITKKNSLILSSNCWKNKFFINSVNKVIKKKFGNNKNLKASVIITAKYGLRNKSRNIIYKDLINKVKKYDLENKLGLKFEYIDCSSKKNIEDFKKSINKNKVILVLGGDTYYLLYHLKNSNMDKLIYKRVKEDNVLYIGCCAGAILAGKSILPASIARLNSKSTKYYIKNLYKKNFWNKENNKSLKLINKNILPHCSSKSKTIKIKNNELLCLKEHKPLIK